MESRVWALVMMALLIVVMFGVICNTIPWFVVIMYTISICCTSILLKRAFLIVVMEDYIRPKLRNGRGMCSYDTTHSFYDERIDAILAKDSISMQVKLFSGFTIKV